MAFPIIPTNAPNLPLGPDEYERQYADQLNNILRLYFKTIDNFTQNITIPVSGNTASRPTEDLAVGEVYFDTTLGFPIWWDGTNWVDATGASA
jgi:hypothetical protein